MTIGTSAPPTGSTKRTPNSNESTPIIASDMLPPECTTQTPVPSTPIKVAAITNRPPGNTTGRVVMISWSFKKVITEPEKETEPTTTVKTVAIVDAVSLALLLLNERYSTIETSAAAPPPTPLKSATSCGIWVI